MSLAEGDRVKVRSDLRADDPKSKWAKRRRGRPGRVIRTMSRTVQVHFTDTKFPEDAWFYPDELEYVPDAT